MLKSIGIALFQRVILAYKTTLVGLGLVAADAIVSTLEVAKLPQWAHVLVAIAASVLALYRGKAPAQTTLPPAA